MKRKFLTPIAVMAILSFNMFGCAGTNDSATAMEDTTMTETQEMAGETDELETDHAMDTDDHMEVDYTEDIDITVDETVTGEGLTDIVDYNDMFESIEDTEQYTIIDLANTSPNLSTFVGLVKQAGMDDDLMRQGSFTVFAPTNEAFAKMPKEKLDMLKKPENKAELMSVIMAHVLPNKVTDTQFNSSQRIEVAEDKYIPVSVDAGGTRVTVGGATILKSNVEASNGVLHVVDNVITPSSGTSDGLR